MSLDMINGRPTTMQDQIEIWGNHFGSHYSEAQVVERIAKLQLSEGDALLMRPGIEVGEALAQNPNLNSQELPELIDQYSACELEKFDLSNEEFDKAVAAFVIGYVGEKYFSRKSQIAEEA
jgi:hypothetical protein